MAIPVFVMGNNRSGTKWMSNILLNHPAISGIQSEYHRGILETNLFLNFQNLFGDLNHHDTFIGFVEVFSQTDFFKLTELDKDFLYTIGSRNYFDIFREVMDRYAKNTNSDIWLQKAHIFSYTDIDKHFKDARFIFVKRKMIDNIRSSFTLQKRLGNHSGLLKNVLIYIYSEKILKKYKHHESVFVINYEDLKNNPSHAVAGVCEFLGVEFNKDILKVSYKINTSYRNSTDKALLKSRHIIFLNIAHLLLKLLPKGVYDFIFRNIRGFFKREARFIAGTFSMICDQKGFDKVEY